MNMKINKTAYPVSILIKASHYQPTSEMPFEWHFAGGLIVTRDSMLTGYLGLYINVNDNAYYLRPLSAHQQNGGPIVP